MRAPMSAEPKVASVTSGHPCAMKTSCDSSGACAAMMSESRTPQMPLTTTRAQAIRARTSDRHGRCDAGAAAGGAVERDDPADRLDAIAHVGQAAAAGDRDDVVRCKADTVVGDGEAG